MNQQACLKKCRELADAVREEIVSRCMTLLLSGAIDMDSYEDDYRLPKVLVTSAIPQCEEMFRPHSDELKELVKELRKI